MGADAGAVRQLRVVRPDQRLSIVVAVDDPQPNATDTCMAAHLVDVALPQADLAGPPPDDQVGPQSEVAELLTPS